MFRDRNNVLWISLAAALLLVLNLPGPVNRGIKSAFREGIAPLQGLISTSSSNLREAGQALRGLGGVASENQRLHQELVRLRTDAQRLKELERENLALRRQLRYAHRSRRELIAAEVIARDISGWWQTVRLNKGALDGIRENRAVISTEGVVGRTVDVSLRTCDVLLLSDPGCKLSASILRNDTAGVISGRGVSWSGRVALRMDFINKDKTIREGDEVVTSGKGGLFPPGLLVGYVESTERDASGLYLSSMVVPRADLGALNHVFIVAAEDDPVEDLIRTRRERDAGEGES